MGHWLTQGEETVDNVRLCPSPVTVAEVSATLPFVIPSAAEGPAVRLSRTHLFKPTVTVRLAHPRNGC
jgi:hypothetical protein